MFSGFAPQSLDLPFTTFIQDALNNKFSFATLIEKLLNNNAEFLKKIIELQNSGLLDKLDAKQLRKLHIETPLVYETLLKRAKASPEILLNSVILTMFFKKTELLILLKQKLTDDKAYKTLALVDGTNFSYWFMTLRRSIPIETFIDFAAFLQSIDPQFGKQTLRALNVPDSLFWLPAKIFTQDFLKDVHEMLDNYLKMFPSLEELRDFQSPMLFSYLEQLENLTGVAGFVENLAYKVHYANITLDLVGSQNWIDNEISTMEENFLNRIGAKESVEMYKSSKNDTGSIARAHARQHIDARIVEVRKTLENYHSLAQQIDSHLKTLPADESKATSPMKSPKSTVSTTQLLTVLKPKDESKKSIATDAKLPSAESIAGGLTASTQLPPTAISKLTEVSNVENDDEWEMVSDSDKAPPHDDSSITLADDYAKVVKAARGRLHF